MPGLRGWLPGCGAGEFKRATLFIAASALEAAEEMFEKKVPPDAWEGRPSMLCVYSLLRFAAIACSFVGVSIP